MPKKEPTGFGEEFAAWQIHEYPKHERTWFWYFIVGLVGAILILYAVFTANFLFALIILMVGVISLISGFRHPELVDITLTSSGVLIGTDFYSYHKVKDFSIVYNPPEVKVLYFDFYSRVQPVVSISLEDIDPNEIREALLPYVAENIDRNEETNSDLFTRLYKF